MLVDLQTAWAAPLRRIYLVWGLVLIIGFILSGLGFWGGYLHWYVLSLIGISSQVLKMRLTHWKARFFLVMWAVVSLAGTLENQAVLSGWIEAPLGEINWHFQFLWLIVLSIPQFITGLILKSKFQMGLGVVWMVLGLSLLTNTQ